MINSGYIANYSSSKSAMQWPSQHSVAQALLSMNLRQPEQNYHAPIAQPARAQQQQALLTPPGSPDEKGLIIVDSPLKAAYNQPSLPQPALQRMSADHQVVQKQVASSSADESTNLPSYFEPLSQPTFPAMLSPDLLENPILARALMTNGAGLTRSRARGEKRQIPSEQKDEKYFERRRRNNIAAKRSRNYRKQREDEVAIRAMQLERENAYLRAEILTLREESSQLREIVIQKSHQRAAAVVAGMQNGFPTSQLNLSF